MPIPIDEAIAAARARAAELRQQLREVNAKAWAEVIKRGVTVHPRLVALRTAKARGATHTDEGEYVMGETKEFPTADVLSTITGVLVSPIGGVYEVLNWMTGESVYTHQIPRICKEAIPVLLKTYPELAQARDEAKAVMPENWQRWLAVWLDRYGSTIAVPKFDADTHEQIDPLSELVEKIHPSRIATLSAATGSGE